MSNAADSTTDQFFVYWANAEGRLETSKTDFYVAPGSSRVLRMPKNENALDADRLLLKGDRAAFDNEYFLAPEKQITSVVAYIGTDRADDAEGMLYFLQRVFVETRKSKIKFEVHDAGERIDWLPGTTPDLLVVTGQLSQQQLQQVNTFIRSGGTALFVLQDESVVNSLEDLVSAVPKPIDVEQSTRSSMVDYRMIAEIDFSHPLFVPLSGARYNDFTKIRFWKHLPVTVPESADVRVIASLDNGDAVLWQRKIEQGTVYCLASGWQPQSSQLALSTKFVPLMNGMLSLAKRGGGISPSGQVNQPISFADYDAGSSKSKNEWTVDFPDGSQRQISRNSPPVLAHRPGIYQIRTAASVVPASKYQMAVNLWPRESMTAPINVEQLEALSVKLGSQPDKSEQQAKLQKIRNVDLEHRQHFWKWLIVTALVLLVLETLVAARASKKSTSPGLGQEAVVT